MDQKIFSSRKFLLGLKYFRSNIFWEPKYFWGTEWFLGPECFLGPKLFLGPKYIYLGPFLGPMFLGPIFSFFLGGGQLFLGSKYFCSQQFLNVELKLPTRFEAPEKKLGIFILTKFSQPWISINNMLL